MDFVFWIGLLLPLLLSIPLGIVANIYSDPVREFVSKRRHIRLNKQRTRELRLHHRALLIKQGDPTALTDLWYMQFLTLVGLLTTLIFGGLLLVLLGYRADLLQKMSNALFLTVYSGMTIFLTLTWAMVAVFFHLVRVTMFRVRNFERYEQEMRAKWGPEIV